MGAAAAIWYFGLMAIAAILTAACAGLATVGASMFAVGLFKGSKKLKVLGAWAVGVSCLGMVPVAYIWLLYRS